MKTYRIFISIVILSSCFLSACDKESDGPSEEQVFLKKIGHAWSLTAGRVTLDNVDVSGAFAGMTITFTGEKQYTVTNAVPPIWPAQGSFTLVKVDRNQFNIQRDDGMLIEVSDLTDETVTLKFQHTATGGRTRSVSGQYAFVMHR